MTKKHEIQREDVIKWQEKYKHKIEACMNEALEYALTNPSATTCVIRRKRATYEFKVALAKSCEESNMTAEFDSSNEVTIVFHSWEYLAAWFGC